MVARNLGSKWSGAALYVLCSAEKGVRDHHRNRQRQSSRCDQDVGGEPFACRWVGRGADHGGPRIGLSALDRHFRPHRIVSLRGLGGPREIRDRPRAS